MRCVSLKEFLVFVSVWHISQEMKDILEDIQPSDDNPSELNAFFEEVMKLKNAFRLIRRASAEADPDSLSRDRRDKDIDEYVYDEENLSSNNENFKNEKSTSHTKISPLQKPNRPLNDIYPHIYKPHSDLEYTEKYFDSLNFDKGMRYRRQLAEDVDVKPKSTRGNLEVSGEKAAMVNDENKARLVEKGAQETLMTIFSHLEKTTYPAQETTNSNSVSEFPVTDAPHTQNTNNNIPTTESSTSQFQDNKLSTTEKPETSTQESNNLNKRELSTDFKNDELVTENCSKDKGHEVMATVETIQKSVTNEYSTEKRGNGHDEKNQPVTVRQITETPENIKNIDISSSTSKEKETVTTRRINDIPKFVGTIIGEIKNNYENNEPNFVRPRPRIRYRYRPYAIYLQDPRSMYYNNIMKNIIFSTPFRRRNIQTFAGNAINERTSDEDFDAPYHTRTLKSISNSNTSRMTRDIHEILGMDNEDDYIEDLAFKTDSKTLKSSEDEDELSSLKTSIKSKKSKTGVNTGSTTATYHSTETTVKPLTTNTYKGSSYFETVEKLSTTAIPSRKISKKYHRIKKRKLLTRLMKRFHPYTKNAELQILNNDGEKMVKINDKIIGRNMERSITNDYGTDSNLKKDYQEKRGSLSVNNKYERRSPSHKRLFYTAYKNWYFNDDPSDVYQKTRYFHYRPRSISYPQPINFYPNTIRNFRIRQNNGYLQPQNIRYDREKICSHCRKLMSNSNGSSSQSIRQKRDVIDGTDYEEFKEPTEVKEKRTESDYGDEPDLSEGQTFKKHEKVKEFTKVPAPSRNFDDNYEYEEVPRGKSNSLEVKKNFQPNKLNEKNKLLLKEVPHHQSSQNSLRSRLEQLKNKLFKCQPDEAKKASTEHFPFNYEQEEGKRTERESKTTRLRNQEHGMNGPSSGMESAADSDNRQKYFDSSCSPCNPGPSPCIPCPSPLINCPCEPCPDEPCPENDQYSVPPSCPCPCEPYPCPPASNPCPFPDPYSCYPCPGPCPSKRTSDEEDTDNMEYPMGRNAPSPDYDSRASSPYQPPIPNQPSPLGPPPSPSSDTYKIPTACGPTTPCEQQPASSATPCPATSSCNPSTPCSVPNSCSPFTSCPPPSPNNSPPLCPPYISSNPPNPCPSSVTCPPPPLKNRYAEKQRDLKAENDYWEGHIVGERSSDDSGNPDPLSEREDVRNLMESTRSLYRSCGPACSYPCEPSPCPFPCPHCPCSSYPCPYLCPDDSCPCPYPCSPPCSCPTSPQCPQFPQCSCPYPNFPICSYICPSNSEWKSSDTPRGNVKKRRSTDESLGSSSQPCPSDCPCPPPSAEEALTQFLREQGLWMRYLNTPSTSDIPLNEDYETSGYQNIKERSETGPDKIGSHIIDYQVPIYCLNEFDAYPFIYHPENAQFYKIDEESNSNQFDPSSISCSLLCLKPDSSLHIIPYPCPYPSTYQCPPNPCMKKKAISTNPYNIRDLFFSPYNEYNPGSCPCPFLCPCPSFCPCRVHSSKENKDINSQLHDIKERCPCLCQDICSTPVSCPNQCPCPCPDSSNCPVLLPCPIPCPCPCFSENSEEVGSSKEEKRNTKNDSELDHSEFNENDRHKVVKRDFPKSSPYCCPPNFTTGSKPLADSSFSSYQIPKFNRLIPCSCPHPSFPLNSPEEKNYLNMNIRRNNASPNQAQLNSKSNHNDRRGCFLQHSCPGSSPCPWSICPCPPGLGPYRCPYPCPILCLAPSDTENLEEHHEEGRSPKGQNVGMEANEFNQEQKQVRDSSFYDKYRDLLFHNPSSSRVEASYDDSLKENPFFKKRELYKLLKQKNANNNLCERCVFGFLRIPSPSPINPFGGSCKGSCTDSNSPCGKCLFHIPPPECKCIWTCKRETGSSGKSKRNSHSSDSSKLPSVSECSHFRDISGPSPHPEVCSQMMELSPLSSNVNLQDSNNIKQELRSDDPNFKIRDQNSKTSHANFLCYNPNREFSRGNGGCPDPRATCESTIKSGYNYFQPHCVNNFIPCSYEGLCRNTKGSHQRMSNSRCPSASASEFSTDSKLHDAAQKRSDCPKPCERLPPCSGSPSPGSLPCDDTTDDMLAQKARRVNEYLKNQYLRGHYTISNDLLPRNKRHLTSRHNTYHFEQQNDNIREVRRPHGVPKKLPNQKLPAKDQNLEFGDGMTHKNKLVEQHNILRRSDAEDEGTYPAEKNSHSDTNVQKETGGKNELDPDEFIMLKKTNPSECQDMQFAKDIVETIIEKVNKNTNLKTKIGNALNKKRIYESESCQRNVAQLKSFEEREEYEEAKNLLKSVSSVLNKLVKKQIDEKLCERLPSHLKNFLKRIVRPSKHRMNQRHDDKYHEDTFLFRTSYPPTKLDSKTKRQLERNLVKMLDRYNHLGEDSKKRAAPLKNYISNHLGMLKNIDDSKLHTDSKTIDVDTAFGMHKKSTEESKEEYPMGSRNSFDNLESIEKDLENTDIGMKTVSSFSKPTFGMTNFSPGKVTEEREEVEKSMKKRNINRGKSIGEKNDENHIINNALTSDKYKKLVRAAEEVRCKRRNEDKIAELFGDRKDFGNGLDVKEDEDQIAFDTPLVYRT